MNSNKSFIGIILVTHKSKHGIALGISNFLQDMGAIVRIFFGSDISDIFVFTDEARESFGSCPLSNYQKPILKILVRDSVALREESIFLETDSQTACMVISSNVNYWSAERIFDIIQSKIDGDTGRESPILQNGFQLYEGTLGVYQSAHFTSMYFDKWHNNLPAKKIDRFLKYVPKESSILDAGCGPGHHSFYIHNKSYKVVGLDQSQSFIDMAKTNYQGPLFIKGDMRKFSFVSGVFDGIWACASLVHFPPNIFRQQIERFSFWLSERGVCSIIISIGKKPNVSPDGRVFFSFQSERELFEVFSENNIDIIYRDDEVMTDTTFGEQRTGVWSHVIGQKSR